MHILKPYIDSPSWPLTYVRIPFEIEVIDLLAALISFQQVEFHAISTRKKKEFLDRMEIEYTYVHN